MSRVSFVHDDLDPGEGASRGIPRGIRVQQGGLDLTQEGLGLGAIALNRGGLTYFPGASRTSADGPHITREFSVDSAMVFSSPFFPLSNMMPIYGLGTRAYMMLPGCQDRLLDLRSRAFSRLRVRPELRRTRAWANARFNYELGADAVKIRADIVSLGGPLPDMFVLNELGADHFRSAVRNGITGPPPTGWCPLPDELPSPALLDEEHGTTFFIDRVKASGGIDPRIFWGRERKEDLCWAGFELELRNPEGLMVASIEYEIKFGELVR